IPERRRSLDGSRLTLVGASENNLKNVTLELPLGGLVCVTGISGSGKTTLIKSTLFHALSRLFHQDFESQIGRFERLLGAEALSGVCLMDQAPIGRTLRSNALTYMKAFDDVRKIFSDSPKAKRLGLEMR